MDRKKLIGRLFSLIFLILILNFLANKFYWYYSIWYFDMVMHFLGGFWLGLASLYFLMFRGLSRKSIFTILGSVLLFGVGWEVFELLFYNYIAQNSVYILDVSSDIFFDLAGGACAILYFFHRIAVNNENTV